MSVQREVFKEIQGHCSSGIIDFALSNSYTARDASDQDLKIKTTGILLLMTSETG